MRYVKCQKKKKRKKSEKKAANVEKNQWCE